MPDSPPQTGLHIYVSAVSARSGGGVTYLDHILHAFPSGQGHRLFVLSNGRFDTRGNPDVALVAVPRWTANPVARFALGLLYFRSYFRKRRCDIIYFPGGSIDLPVPRRARVAVAFRNMLPFAPTEAARYPRFSYERLRLALLRRLQARAFKRADLVVFISEYARRVIDVAVPRRRGRSVVIPHGVVEHDPKGLSHRRSDLPERYVAYVSMIDAYKAQVEVVEAWAAMTRRRPTTEKLLLVGPTRAPYYEKRLRQTIDRLELNDKVKIYGGVPPSAIYSIYSNAIFNVFASSCENCPNILLEILSTGSPVISSRFEPMPEFGGPEIEYFDPYDIDSLSLLMENYLDDPARRAISAKAAIGRARFYSWQRTASATWASILALGTSQ
jgi:glycosyltransferase involved in cell wall biosynthesis